MMLENIFLRVARDNLLRNNLEGISFDIGVLKLFYVVLEDKYTEVSGIMTSGILKGSL